MFEIGDLYFWRQHFILCTIWFSSFPGGIMNTFPSVLNPSILDPNGTDIRATVDEASWIASSTGISAAPAFLILPLIMQRFGRKATNILLNLSMVFGWVAFIFAKNKTTLLIGRMFHGVQLGSTIVNLIFVGEYASPKRRGYFTTTKKFAVALGTFLCHVLYLRLSWRQIAGVGIISNLLGAIMSFFWPESPTYLVTKNRYEECERSFTWLHGSKNKEELLDLISMQEAKSKNQKAKKNMYNYCNIIYRKDFQKAFSISVLLILLLETCGRHYFPVYLIQMMVELLGDKSTAMYICIGYDILSLVGLVIAMIVIYKVKRRPLLLYSGGFAVLLMFITSATLFLKSFYPLANLDYWSVSIILMICLVTNIGVIPMVFTLISEIFPIDSKGLGVSVSGISLAITFTVAIKVTPSLIKVTGLSGTFFINACLSGVILCILHFIMPETKDRTLLDIERELRGEVASLKETMPMI